MSCCNRCMPTPQSIIEADPNRDVFVDIFGNDSSDEFANWAKKMMWQRYRYTGVGNCNIEYWEQCMVDRYHLIEEKWRLKYEVLQQYSPTDDINLDNYAVSSESESTYEDFPNTVINPSQQYLSNRSKSKSSVSQDTGTLFERINQYTDQIRDYAYDFCQEFEDLFYRGL